MSSRRLESQSPAGDASLIAQWRNNSIGMVGLVLSLVQLAMHGLWIGITEFFASRGNLADVTAASWQAWLIVGLLLLSGIVTMLALFLSLNGSIRGRPRTPAVVGLVISFFTGTFVTFVLLLTALGSGSQL